MEMHWMQSLYPNTILITSYPEIEAIRTERFLRLRESKGYTVIPSAKAANYTMNRKAIRDLAASGTRVKNRSRIVMPTSEEEFESCCR